MLVAVSGCGGGSGGALQTVREGATISPQAYLATSAEATGAVRAFAVGLEASGSSIASLRAVAPSLVAPLERAHRSATVIAVAHLSDARIETQRALVAPGLSRVVASMDRVFIAARDGNRAAFDRARVDMRAATEALRSAVGGVLRGSGTNG